MYDNKTQINLPEKKYYIAYESVGNIMKGMNKMVKFLKIGKTYININKIIGFEKISENETKILLPEGTSHRIVEEPMESIIQRIYEKENKNNENDAL